MWSFVINGVLQILDGTLTYIGIVRHGDVSIEGNPLIRFLVNLMGVGNALFACKSFALCLLWILFKMKDYRVILSQVLIFINLIYAVAVSWWICALYLR